MDKFFLRMAVTACFFFFSTTQSQVPVPSQLAIDSIDPVTERAQIPGETMGQKMESLLFWTVSEKERRFPTMHQIFPSIEIAAKGEIYPLVDGEPLRNELAEGDLVSSYMENNNIGGVIVLK